MTYAQIRQRAARVREIPLELVLQALGARLDRYDRSKWHTDQGPLSVTGMKFMNWRQGVGGGGAIDLVLHLKGLDFKTAVAWLWERFPCPEEATAPRRRAESGLRLPPAAENQLGRVYHYLCLERGLTGAVLEPLIDAGALYADGRGNAVFLLLDRSGLPVGAELRGTTAVRWRGMAPGSRKDLGYFSAGAATASAIVLCESAIDALSLLMLHPGAHCISTSGATPNPRWLPHLLAQPQEVYCGFDSDEAGDRQAEAMIALYPAVKRLRPRQHDWNDELRLHPKRATAVQVSTLHSTPTPQASI